MANVFLYRASVPEKQSSYLEWTECEGFSGPKVLLYDKMRAIDFSAIENTISASSAATITEIGACNPYPNCQCTEYGTTSTTTTTLPVIDYNISAACGGGAGTGAVTMNTFSGGSGVYQSVAIGTDPGNAYNATPINLGGASTYTFNNLLDNFYYVILRDNVGNFKIKSLSVICTIPTTTTTTTTTTAAPICNFNGGSAVYVTPTTTTTTLASTTTTTTTTTTTLPPNIIYVYGKDIGIAGSVGIDYQVNSNSPVAQIINGSSCVSQFTITAFNSGDTITFISSYGMKGSLVTCPGAPNQSQYVYVASSGAQTIYLTIDSDNAL